MLSNHTFEMWLILSALSGFVLFALAALALIWIRQPLDRARIIQCAFLASLAVPLLQLADVLPSIPLNLWNESAKPNLAAPTARSYGSEIALRDPIADHPPLTVVNESVPDTQPTSGSQPSVQSDANASPSTFDLLSMAWKCLQVLYLVGIGICLALLAVGLWRRHCLAATARPADSTLHDLLQSIAGPSGASTRLLIHDDLDAPIMWGLIRPTIVIPAHFLTNTNDAPLRWSLAHEWAHVARFDFAGRLLSILVRLTAFYQPLYWWLNKQLTLSQDYLADALAAQQGDNSADYAEFLVSLTRNRTKRQPAPILGIRDRRTNVVKRVHQLVDSRNPIDLHCRLASGLLITTLAMSAMVGLGSLRLGAAPVDDDKTIEETKQEQPSSETNSAKPLTRSITYSGAIVDRTTGKPIAKAAVKILMISGHDPETLKWNILGNLESESDNQGKYSFTLPPEAVANPSLELGVTARHPQYQTSRMHAFIHSTILNNLAMGDQPNFKIPLAPGEKITGVVIKPDGSPAKDVQVWGAGKIGAEPHFGSGSWIETRTNDQGRFQLTIATTGDGGLWFYSKDYSPLVQGIGKKRGNRSRDPLCFDVRSHHSV